MKRGKKKKNLKAKVFVAIFILGLTTTSFWIALQRTTNNTKGLEDKTPKKSDNREVYYTVSPTSVQKEWLYIYEINEQEYLNETKQWQRFIDSRNGFTLKYPPDSYTVESDNEEQYSKQDNTDIKKNFSDLMGYSSPKVLTVYTVRTKFNLPPYHTKRAVVSVWVFANNDNLSLQTWYERYSYYPLAYGKVAKGYKDPWTSEDIMLNGFEGRGDPYAEGTMFKSGFLLFSRDEKVILIMAEELNTTDSPGRKIVSTFKFQ